MKNIKTLIVGIIIGAAVTVSITALAEYITTPNPYPVKVNGQEVQVEGYNINDNTYFKLRDVADAVGGFSVDFADNTIIVNTDGEEGVPAPTPVPTATDTPDTEPVASVKNTPNPKLGYEDWEVDMLIEEGIISGFTSDGLPIHTLEDGNKYVNTTDVEAVYDFQTNGYGFAVGKICDNNYNIVLDNISIAPASIKNNNIYIELSYYENTLVAWLQEKCS